MRLLKFLKTSISYDKITQIPMKLKGVSMFEELIKSNRRQPLRQKSKKLFFKLEFDDGFAFINIVDENMVWQWTVGIRECHHNYVIFI